MTTVPSESADLSFLKSLDSPTVANAVQLLDLRDRTQGYLGGGAQCMFPELGPMVGRAITVQMASAPGPIAGRKQYWKMWEGVQLQESPSVLVIQDVSSYPLRAAFCGEVMATLAMRLGAVGLVTDGGVRDLEEVSGLGFHYFASSAVVSRGNFEVLTVGEPVSLFGERVRSGDLLHADVNGVTIVPENAVARLTAAVEDIHASERAVLDFIRGSDFSLDELRRRSDY